MGSPTPRAWRAAAALRRHRDTRVLTALDGEPARRLRRPRAAVRPGHRPGRTASCWPCASTRRPEAGSRLAAGQRRGRRRPRGRRAAPARLARRRRGGPAGSSSSAPAGPTTARPAASTSAATARCWSSRPGCAPRSSSRDRQSWPEATARLARTALSIGVATGAYGVSFGALGVAAGFSVAQTCAMSVLIFTGGLAVRPGRGHGGGGAARSSGRVRGAARRPQRRVRRPARPAAAAARPTPTAGAQLVIDESTAVALGADAVRGPRRRGWASGPPASRCSCCGTSPPSSARWPAMPSATRGPRPGRAAPAAFLALLAPRLAAGQPG